MARMVAEVAQPPATAQTQPELNTGVYCIRNKVNGKMYVGSAARSFASRWGNHRSRLRRGIHVNRHLQAAWNKHGEDAFDFFVLERCHPRECVDTEQRFIDNFCAADNKHGYNLAPLAGSCLGTKRTPEQNAANSKRQIGKKVDPMWIENNRRAQQRRLSTEHGLRKAREHVAKFFHSDSAKKKATIGKRRYWENPSRDHVNKLAAWRKSDARRRLVSLQMKGVKKSPEHAAKLRANFDRIRARGFSEETRKKMSESAKRRCDEAWKNKMLASRGLTRKLEPHVFG